MIRVQVSLQYGSAVGLKRSVCYQLLPIEIGMLPALAFLAVNNERLNPKKSHEPVIVLFSQVVLGHLGLQEVGKIPRMLVLAVEAVKLLSGAQISQREYPFQRIRTQTARAAIVDNAFLPGDP